MKPASARFVNFRQLGDFKWRWPHFRPYEMACRGTDELLVVPSFMDWLEGVRHIYGQGMVITSGYAHRGTRPLCLAIVAAGRMSTAWRSTRWCQARMRIG